MELLKQRIIKDAIVRGGNVLKVDSFLNHQLDISLLNEIGKEFYKLFGDLNITRIFTIEASGIAIASIAAQYFNVPVVFAKKAFSKNLEGEILKSPVTSFTKGTSYDVMVEAKFLHTDDRILIIDDFLAKGSALLALADIVKQSGATLSGAGIVIEKGFQEGGKLVRSEGINLKSLAVIKSMDEGKIVFSE